MYKTIATPDTVIDRDQEDIIAIKNVCYAIASRDIDMKVGMKLVNKHLNWRKNSTACLVLLETAIDVWRTKPNELDRKINLALGVTFDQYAEKPKTSVF